MPSKKRNGLSKREVKQMKTPGFYKTGYKVGMPTRMQNLSYLKKMSKVITSLD